LFFFVAHGLQSTTINGGSFSAWQPFDVDSLSPKADRVAHEVHDAIRHYNSDMSWREKDVGEHCARRRPGIERG
jgi:hypothetical protein